MGVLNIRGGGGGRGLGLGPQGDGEQDEARALRLSIDLFQAAEPAGQAPDALGLGLGVWDLGFGV